MTNQEAVDMIQNGILLQYNVQSRTYRKALNMAIEALKAQLSAKDTTFDTTFGKWIPCSERLPEYAKFYLTSTEDDSVYCDFYDGYRFLRTEKVIAWMEMPEPYTEEEQ